MASRSTKHLHVTKPKAEISKNESFNSGINTPNIRSAKEGKDRVHLKQSKTNRQKFTILDSRRQDNEEDNDDLGLCLLATKIVGEFKERLDWL